MHSFWMPALGGKRDLITNHTNYLWFTPGLGRRSRRGTARASSTAARSHANMRFKAFTVTPAEFEQLGRASGDARRVRRRRRRPRPRALRRRGATPTPADARPAGRSRRRAARRRHAGARGLVAASRHRRTPRRDRGAGGLHRIPAREDAGVHDSADAAPDGSHVRRRRARDGQRGERREAVSTVRAACIGCHTIARQPDDGRASSGRTSRTSASARRSRAGLYPERPAASRALDQERAR